MKGFPLVDLPLLKGGGGVVECCDLEHSSEFFDDF